MGGTQLNKYVAGIGINKAAIITYYAYTNLVGEFTKYPEARELTIAAARKLYGICSFEENQTCKAWSACNIGQYCEPCEFVPIAWGCDAQVRSNPTNVEDLEFKKRTMKVYPNPTKSELFVNFGELTLGDRQNLNLAIEIFDVNGKLLVSKIPDVNDVEVRLEVSKLVPGIYLLRINGYLYSNSIRFIKE